MATTSHTPPPAATNGASKKSASKRIPKPDKHAFDVKLTALEKELKEKNASLLAARQAISGNGNGKSSQNSERDQLRKELDELKAKQATIKGSRAKVYDEIAIIDSRIKKKVADLQASKGKLNFKNADEVEKHIQQLEKSVESGNLRLAEEKKVVKEISTLKKLKKNFDSFATAQASIDADKAKIAELKATLDDKESKAISARFNEVRDKLDAIRAASQEAHKNLNSLYDTRNAAQKEVDAVNQKIKALKDEYYTQLRQHKEQIRAEIAARHERERAEREAIAREKKLAAAKAKLEAASEPAYATEIANCRLVLSALDPNFKIESSSTINTFGPASLGSTLEKPQVDLEENVRIIKKEEESYYVGKGKKKSKGKKKKEEVSNDNKLTLDYSLVEQLYSLDITVPASKDDVPNTIEAVKKKLDYYLENEERVTKERIEKAKAQIAKMEAEEEESSKDTTESTTEKIEPASEEKSESAEVSEDLSAN